MKIVLLLCLIAVTMAYPRPRKGRPGADRRLDFKSDDRLPRLPGRNGGDDSSESDDVDSSSTDLNRADSSTEDEDQRDSKSKDSGDRRRLPDEENRQDDESPEGSTRRPGELVTSTGTRPTMTTDRDESHETTNNHEGRPRSTVTRPTTTTGRPTTSVQI